VDGQTLEAFEAQLDQELDRLQRELKEDTYQPLPVRQHRIPKRDKPGEYRMLGIPAIYDRVCQQALLNRLEPIFEPIFDDASFGYRRGRSTKDALRKVWREIQSGSEWIVDADLRDFFGSADHEKLLTLVAQRVADGRVLRLIQAMLKAGSYDKGQLFPSERGTPQGSVVSPALSTATAVGWESAWSCNLALRQQRRARRNQVKSKTMLAIVMAGVCLMSVPAARAQAAASSDNQTISDQDIQLLRQDLRSQKKQLVAANLKLTDTEATKIWPIYDQYVAELTKVNNDKYAAVKEYANNYGTLTDAQALDLTKRLLAVDNAVAQLRMKYVPIVNGVLPGVKTATFFQIDRRLTMLIDIQLASSLPLIQNQQPQ